MLCLLASPCHARLYVACHASTREYKPFAVKSNAPDACVPYMASIRGTSQLPLILPLRSFAACRVLHCVRACGAHVCLPLVCGCLNALATSQGGRPATRASPAALAWTVRGTGAAAKAETRHNQLLGSTRVDLHHHCCHPQHQLRMLGDAPVAWVLLMLDAHGGLQP